MNGISRDIGSNFWETFQDREGLSGKVMGGTYDFKRVGDNPDGHKLLSIVAAIHHQGIREALNYGALGFAEALHCVAASRMRDVDWGADLDVITAMMEDLLATLVEYTDGGIAKKSQQFPA